MNDAEVLNMLGRYRVISIRGSLDIDSNCDGYSIIDYLYRVFFKLRYIIYSRLE